MTSEGRGSFDPRRQEGIEEAGVWIRDTLGRAEGFYHLGYSSARPAAWRSLQDLLETTHLEEFRLVAEGLRARGRAKEGLVVLVSDDRQDGRARTYLAAQLARLLAEGGARVLLLDGEFEQEGPADWLGDPQREGLLDVARYGTSPRAALQKSGIERVDLMGVGSYRPRESEPLGEEELWSALHQLRLGWQFVLCIAPSRTLEGGFNPLLERCDGVLLGLVLGDEARDGFEELAEHLLEREIPIYGVMAFSRAGEVEEPSEEAEEEKTLVRRVDGTEAATTRSPYATGRAGSPHESSRLFRRVTLGIAAVLLIFLGAWGAILWSQRTATSPQALHGKQTPVATRRPPAPEGAARSAGGKENTVAPKTPAPPVDLERAVLAGSTPGAEATVAQKPPRVEETPETSLLAALRQRPSRGWALHPWSFRDSTMALPSLRRLRRDGMDPIVVRVDLGSKGVWYRVLVGNYATRKEALAAREILAKRRDVIDSVGIIKVGE